MSAVCGQKPYLPAERLKSLLLEKIPEIEELFAIVDVNLPETSGYRKELERICTEQIKLPCVFVGDEIVASGQLPDDEMVQAILTAYWKI